MKIFLTGSTGFIGSRLLGKLPSSDEIYALYRRDPGTLPENIRILQGDLDSPDDLFFRLSEIRPDVCIHLAWEGIPDYGYKQSLRNLEHSSKLMQHLVEECGCKKIIAAGSCWEYNKAFGPCSESDPGSHGGNHFVWAKRSLCDFGLMLASRYKISFFWTRLFYVYGPGQRSGSLIPTIAEALLKGVPPNIQTPSNANDFVYVDDVADAMIQLVYREVLTGIYNLGTGYSVPVWKVCEILERSLGYEPSCAAQMKALNKSVTADFWADTTKSSLFLKWRASTTLEEGIGQYIRTIGVRN
jgi:nucleoside-diphosphate-sugar epimerase